MSKLFLLLGKSNSGKSTILNELLELIQEEDNLKLALSWTTRPKRKTIDQEYVYTDDTTFYEYYKSNKLLEYATYNTEHGIWHYFTPTHSLELDKHNYIKIINPLGYSQMQSHPLDIVTFEIICDDEIRLNRSISRGDNQAEALRRLEADNNDFQHLKTDYTFLNDGCLTTKEMAIEIYKVIKKELN